MVDETLNTTNTFVAPGKIHLSDDEVIKQLSENLQNITPEEIDGMSEEMNEAKKKEKRGERYWKDVDPTRSLKKLSKDVDESMKALPIDKVDEMVNDENLKRGCVILLELARFANYCGREDIISDGMKEAILSWVDGNKIIKERILGFINKAISEPAPSWEDQIWPSYNELLKPLFDLVWSQENDVVRKYLAEYIAKTGLFPFYGANLDIFKDEKLNIKNEDGYRILCAGISNFYPWVPNVAPVQISEWSYKPNNDLTKFLDLFNVNYSTEMEEGDVKITVKPRESIPYSLFETMDVEKSDLRYVTQGKLKELQSSDLVLIYKNNSVYKEMNRELEKLVKNKYGGKVYCIVFPEGFDGSSLGQQSKDILGKIVDTCSCLTDESVSQMIGKVTKKIESVLPSKRKYKNKGEKLAKSMFGK